MAKQKYKDVGADCKVQDPHYPCHERVTFLAFTAIGINCTAGVDKNSGRIAIISAAERFLGLKDVKDKELCEVLTRAVSLLSGPRTCVGLRVNCE